ncbi:MAG: hypothetical protein O3B68_12045 [Planctomycetota bacterium]|nr:hypothetical protein [Planctomycetota bacterium]
MAKLAFTAISSVAVLALLAEGLAGGLLWSQGRLNPDAIREIRVILADPAALTEEQELAKETPVVSVEDVARTRAIAILHLEERENESAIFNGLLADQRQRVLAEQDNLIANRERFDKEKKERQAKKAADGIQKSIAVLLASDTELAIAQLSKLTLEENILLMEEMPEKTIAKLLSAFAEGDRDQIERGQQIFQAITRGETEEVKKGAKK